MLRKAKKAARKTAQKSTATMAANGHHNGESAHHSNGHAGNGTSNGSKSLDSASDNLAQAQPSLGPIKTHSGVDLTEKIKELIRLAQEQGYLTYGDVND